MVSSINIFGGYLVYMHAWNVTWPDFFIKNKSLKDTEKQKEEQFLVLNLVTFQNLDRVAKDCLISLSPGRNEILKIILIPCLHYSLEISVFIEEVRSKLQPCVLS